MVRSSTPAVGASAAAARARESLSAAEARRVALAAQGLARARAARPATRGPGTRQVNATMRRLGVVQIDSVNVFARAHHMPFFSRLGTYDAAAADRLFFGRRGPYTEYAAHENALIPIEDWGLWRFRMDERRGRYTAPGSWFAANRATVEWVRAELGERGAVRPAEIETDAHRATKGPWWDWSGVKRALEILWLTGEVAIAGRRGFERRYALARDVIPAGVLALEIPARDAIRELVRRAARAYGVATAADLADYYRLRDRRAVLAAIGDLVEAGELTPVRVSGWDSAGRPQLAWLHQDARLPRSVDAVALLSPFDPLVWFRERAERLLGFDYRIEIYTPAARRRFGYYSLPALVGDRVAARVDLKADRATGTLLVQSAWWEPAETAGPGASHRGEARRVEAERLGAELMEAARWQALEAVSLSDWGDAVDELASALPGAGRHPRGPA